MLKFTYTSADGNLCVVHARAKADIEKFLKKELTDKEYYDHVYERSIPADATNVVQITEDDLPESRVFRNAWTVADNKVTVKLDKAKDIHMYRIRLARSIVFKELDQQWLLALAQKDQAAMDAIEAKRQELRDYPQAIQDKIKKCKCPVKLDALFDDKLLTVNDPALKKSLKDNRHAVHYED